MPRWRYTPPAHKQRTQKEEDQTVMLTPWYFKSKLAHEPKRFEKAAHNLCVLLKRSLMLHLTGVSLMLHLTGVTLFAAGAALSY